MAAYEKAETHTQCRYSALNKSLPRIDKFFCNMLYASGRAARIAEWVQPQRRCKSGRAAVYFQVGGPSDRTE